MLFGGLALRCWVVMRKMIKRSSKRRYELRPVRSSLTNPLLNRGIIMSRVVFRTPLGDSAKPEHALTDRYIFGIVLLFWIPRISRHFPVWCKDGRWVIKSPGAIDLLLLQKYRLVIRSTSWGNRTLNWRSTYSRLLDLETEVSKSKKTHRYYSPKAFWRLDGLFSFT